MPDDRAPAAAAAGSSRRHFLSRVARGSLALAAAPTLGHLGLGACSPAAPRQAPSPASGEAYWGWVQEQFAIRSGAMPLNAANLCPAPRAVIEAATAAMRDIEGDVSFHNRAKYETTQDHVRSMLAAHLGASVDEIAIVRNTSEGNNIVAGGLPLRAGDEVVLFDQNHPTNNVAWEVRGARFGFTVRRVAVPAPPGSADEIVEIFRRAITPRTRVLAFSDVSNTTGVRLPTAELCRIARERGIYTHVDGAQTFGALQVNVGALGCDSYASSAHKWAMGPKEAGVLYVRAERIPELWPGSVGVGWGNGAETTARGARKFETLGQRNDATIAAFGTALEFREQVGAARIEARVLELAAAMKEGLGRIPGARFATSRAPELSAGVIVMRVDGADMRRLYETLYTEHGIAGAPTGGLRFCPHIYNTIADVERAVAAVDGLVRGRTSTPLAAPSPDPPQPPASRAPGTRQPTR